MARQKHALNTAHSEKVVEFTIKAFVQEQIRYQELKAH